MSGSRVTARRPRLPGKPALEYSRGAMTRCGSFHSYFFGFFRPLAERVERRT